LRASIVSCHCERTEAATQHRNSPGPAFNLGLYSTALKRQSRDVFNITTCYDVVVLEYLFRQQLATVMTVFFDPTSLQYSSRGHPERPERIARTAPLLKNHHPDWQWHQPSAAPDDQLLRAHSREHLERVSKTLEHFDVDTPFYPHIQMHARRSAGAAIEAARSALHGEFAFSLMRPPGHHATQDRAMGFCYFNNIAVAAFDVLKDGAEKLAIWDFDGHHGNGTEAIVANNERIQFASVHQHPAYPGTGTKSFANIANYPVAPYTSRDEIVRVSKHSLEKLIAFKPDLLLVSAGFDAYARDPLLQLTLEQEDFAQFGDWLKHIEVPVAVVLEGGYSNDLPELIDAFLTSWQA
jgi:acetoin utilization deacetylase AcuC-like enzyme